MKKIEGPFKENWQTHYPEQEETNALKEAIAYCTAPTNPEQEEVGGFLAYNKLGEVKFIPVRNENTGILIAKGLYTADKEEFGKKVIPYLLKGWCIKASFHFHPGGFSSQPSSIDLNQLFQTFAKNYIYSTGEGLRVYESFPNPADEEITVLEMITYNYHLTEKDEEFTIWNNLCVKLKE